MIDVEGPENEKEKMKEELYRNSVDIDQENAHFVVVDMVLEVLEVAKWNVSQKYTDDSSVKYRDQELCLNSSSDTSVQRCSAEVLAQKFMLKLGKWVIPTEELLEELPLATISMWTGCEASLTDKILQRSRMRGAFIWTPPQFQIIYSIHPTQRRSEVLASQNFLCAGCGTEVEPRYMKRLSYCNYLGKYFCDCCHVGSESIIPARVLNNWDFGRYSVCQFSHQLLVSIWEKPLFTITSVAKNLYCQAKELQKFREIQEQLIFIKKLLKACRLSDGVLAEFQQLSFHLSQELHLFSMDDLIKIKRGQYLATAKVVMKSATAHVDTCELCQAKGFICEFCHGPDVIFPFQTDVCSRCQDCRSCFHTSCFRNELCPKCVRVQSRKILKET
ncbi:protein associated with UVRAG as autophagy enhancer [Trichomycterus rosablanca]|uniref:protein associated with UVRAG as autophagy enhancer n=1 Tax=Trichomycterus rosablanca TaxID=2290929 RepID=UPI002F35A356